MSARQPRWIFTTPEANNASQSTPGALLAGGGGQGGPTKATRLRKKTELFAYILTRCQGGQPRVMLKHVTFEHCRFHGRFPPTHITKEDEAASWA